MTGRPIELTKKRRERYAAIAAERRIVIGALKKVSDDLELIRMSQLINDSRASRWLLAIAAGEIRRAIKQLEGVGGACGFPKSKGLKWRAAHLRRNAGVVRRPGKETGNDPLQ